MKKQARNPYTPRRTYIPDGEVHVFGDRAYLFGSHDKENGETYCRLSYEVFSAPLNNLSSWTSKGINYSSSQDPIAIQTNRPYRYAPDCVKGKDGRYYLYYCLGGKNTKGLYDGPISVAVSSTPDGKYEFYGHVRNKDGSLFNDHIVFDPAVLNDDGTIRLYYGTYYPFSSFKRFLRPIRRIIEGCFIHRTQKQIKEYDDKIRGAYTVTLEDDRLTVSSQVKPVRDCYSKIGPFKTKMTILPRSSHNRQGHGFFEASSIRKINGFYYFVYSSRNNHELCYATSKYPDKDFQYGGVLVSNGDVGYNGRKEKDRLNYTATNHGCIEKINQSVYVFYHKETHGSDYSRVACAEKIKIKEDGSISQAEITSCGLNNGDLSGKGYYDSFYATYITNGRRPNRNNTKKKHIPRLTNNEKECHLTNLKKSCIIGYRYFDLRDTKKLTLVARGKGTVLIKTNHSEGTKLNIDSKVFSNYRTLFAGTLHEEIQFNVLKGKIEIKGFFLE